MKRKQIVPDLNLDGTNKEISLEEGRKILGKTVENLSDEELRDELAKMQYLVESWLDDFERSVFDGKTLNELLDQKY